MEGFRDAGIQGSRHQPEGLIDSFEAQGSRNPKQTFFLIGPPVALIDSFRSFCNLGCRDPGIEHPGIQGSRDPGIQAPEGLIDPFEVPGSEDSLQGSRDPGIQAPEGLIDSFEVQFQGYPQFQGFRDPGIRDFLLLP